MTQQRKSLIIMFLLYRSLLFRKEMFVLLHGCGEITSANGGGETVSSYLRTKQLLLFALLLLKKMFTKHPRVCRLTSGVPHETPSGVLISTFGVLNKHPWGVYIIHPFLVHCYTPGVNYLKCCCYTPKGVLHTPFF